MVSQHSPQLAVIWFWCPMVGAWLELEPGVSWTSASDSLVVQLVQTVVLPWHVPQNLLPHTAHILALSLPQLLHGSAMCLGSGCVAVLVSCGVVGASAGVAPPCCHPLAAVTVSAAST